MANPCPRPEGLSPEQIRDIRERLPDVILWSHGLDGGIVLSVAERDALCAMAEARHVPTPPAGRRVLIIGPADPPASPLPPPTGWQPMETAPTDGRMLLLYGCQYRRHWFGKGYYFKGVPGDGEGWIAHSFYTQPKDDSSGTFEPSHWQPMLIAPPPRSPARDGA